MNTKYRLPFLVVLFILFFLSSCQKSNIRSVTVPISLDHNRMLVDAEIQRNDSSWRKVRLWVDTGNPVFTISESLARDLGIDLSVAEDTSFKMPNLEVPTPTSLRIGGMEIKMEGVKSRVIFQPFWLFSAIHNDANLPSALLKKYHVVFDYPKKQLTIAEPGNIILKGTPAPANINPETGIVQIDAVIDGDSLSFALDNGASYSFISGEALANFSDTHPEWPRITGTLGCANMWGWWPAHEEKFPVVRIPEIKWGQILLKDVGITGVPEFSPNGPTFGEWYSQKTLRPVDGFLGPNAFKTFCIGIDYKNSLVYFEKGADSDPHEMDLVGLSVRQLPDGNYQITGIVQKDGKPSVEGVEPGDILVKIDNFNTQGATMGSVIDALRGKPGDLRILFLERDGKPFSIKTKVNHFL